MKKALMAAWLLGMALLVGATLAGAAGTPTKATGLTDAALQEKLVAMELKTWDTFKTQDFPTFKAMMSPDALMADVNGFATLDQCEAMMKDYTLDTFTQKDWKLVRIGKDAAVITYTANVTAKFKGSPVPAGPYFVSSVYANRGGKWVGVYHQETLAASAMQNAGNTEPNK